MDASIIRYNDPKDIYIDSVVQGNKYIAFVRGIISGCPSLLVQPYVSLSIKDIL